MTREQAIKQLESLRAHCDSMFGDKWSEHEVWSRDVLAIDIAIATIAAIEDILGDEYDLDELREMVQTKREGRCVVRPVGGYSDKDGETALKNAMFVCSLTNNAVNRYAADAIAEKLTRQEAQDALRREQE